MGKKLALITGGTSGIGLGAAEALAAEFDLALGYAGDQEKAATAKASLAASGANVEVFEKPLASYQDCKELLAQVKQSCGRMPSVLINSHGRIQDGIFMATDFAKHLSVVNELLVTTMALCHLTTKFMYGERWGRIINLSSISGFYAKRGQANYAAAKAGIIGFTRTLALELAHRGITVNAISPGLINTPMTKGILGMIQEQDDLKRRVPAGFVGEPKDIGATIALLCSEGGRYITGANLVIDGGRSLGDAGS